MKKEVVGKGEPEVAVVAGIHGDEPETVKALDRLEERQEFKKPFLKIIANEEALMRGERFIDQDLNRVFPGDADSDVHEEKLAQKLLNELENMKVINLHATDAKKTPFAVISGESDRQVELSRYTGIENVIEMDIMDGDIANFIETVGVEASKDDKGVDQLYQATSNFLKAFNIIEGTPEKVEQEFFRVFDTADGKDYEFTAENFEPVEKGEMYAQKVKRADQKFWPVLASSTGYDDMIGFKAKKVDRSSGEENEESSTKIEKTSLQ